MIEDEDPAAWIRRHESIDIEPIPLWLGALAGLVFGLVLIGALALIERL